MDKQTNVHVATVGILLLIIGILLVWVFSLFNAKSLIQGQVSTGIDVFAVLYIEAQFIERIVEPFSEKTVTGKDLFGDTSKIDDNNQKVKTEKESIEKYTNQMNSLRATQNYLPEVAAKQVTNAIDELQKQKEASNKNIDVLTKETETLSMKRVYSFWGLTALMGMVLVYLTVGLFQTAGYTFQDISLAGVTVLRGHALDAILSGVIVGAGTKPLHDLISTLQKAKTT